MQKITRIKRIIHPGIADNMFMDYDLLVCEIERKKLTLEEAISVLEKPEIKWFLRASKKYGKRHDRPLNEAELLGVLLAETVFDEETISES